MSLEAETVGRDVDARANRVGASRFFLSVSIGGQPIAKRAEQYRFGDCFVWRETARSAIRSRSCLDGQTSALHQ